MRRGIFTLFLLLMIAASGHAADLFVTDFHGISGGSADAWIVVKDAKNDLENFEFIVDFNKDILDFNSIVEQPHTNTGWRVDVDDDLTANGDRDRTRITVAAESGTDALEKDHDYLLFRIRFSVRKNEMTTVRLTDLDDDVAGWSTAEGRFFHTHQSPDDDDDDDDSDDDDDDTVVEASCFLNTL